MGTVWFSFGAAGPGELALPRELFCPEFAPGRLVRGLLLRRFPGAEATDVLVPPRVVMLCTLGSAGCDHLFLEAAILTDCWPTLEAVPRWLEAWPEPGGQLP